MSFLRVRNPCDSTLELWPLSVTQTPPAGFGSNPWHELLQLGKPALLNVYEGQGKKNTSHRLVEIDPSTVLPLENPPHVPQKNKGLHRVEEEGRLQAQAAALCHVPPMRMKMCVCLYLCVCLCIYVCLLV